MAFVKDDQGSFEKAFPDLIKTNLVATGGKKKPSLAINLGRQHGDNINLRGSWPHTQQVPAINLRILQARFV